MKTLLSVLIAGIVLISCSKEAEKISQLSEHFGMYIATNGDSATVSQGNDGMIKIWYADKNPVAFRGGFDSIRVNSDLTFLCNEYTTNNTNKTYTTVGTGSFGAGTLDFHFSIGANIGGIRFTGVKK